MRDMPVTLNISVLPYMEAKMEKTYQHSETALRNKELTMIWNR